MYAKLKAQGFSENASSGGSLKTMLEAPGVGFEPATVWRFLPQFPFFFCFELLFMEEKINL